MELYRLARKKYAVLNGIGAASKGARWNSIGVELIYTAGNRSLAMAELAVHLTLATIPDDFVMMTIFAPDTTTLRKFDQANLPVNWNVFPYLTATQSVGDHFVAENKCCLLQIPSSVTSGDFNFLINPRHPDFKNIKIVDIVRFPFDKRIFR